MKTKYLLSNPFHIGPYGTKTISPFEQIINLKGANNSAHEINPANILIQNTTILNEVKFDILPDNRHDDGEHFDSCMSMVDGVIKSFNDLPEVFDKLTIIGGDHSISIGTGAALSKRFNLKDIGVIYIDTHTDCNTHETSVSKSITGYPLAAIKGFGHPDMLKPFNNNFVDKVVYIGIRDIDPAEIQIFNKLNALSYNILDVELFGVSKIVKNSLEHLKDCKYIWLSIDIDVLDPVYFESDGTDELAPAGMTPRELLTIISEIEKSNKLKITEIVQINYNEKITPIIWLASRLVEMSLGLGRFRYGE